MGFNIGDVLTGGASAAVGAGMGLLLEGHNDRRQINQQQKLTDIQTNAQRNLTEFNRQQQEELWKNTSYPAQMTMLKEAGLNPGLLYGGGAGSGGSTNLAQGSVSSGNAQQNPGEIQQGMGLSMQAMQLSLLKAQKENIEADTADKLAGVPVKGAQVPNITQDTRNKEATERGTNIDNQIKDIELRVAGATMYDRETIMSASALKIAEELDQLYRQGKIQEATFEATVKQKMAESIGAGLKNLLTEQQTKAVEEGVKQGWRDLEIKNFLGTQNIETTQLGQIIGLVNNVLSIFGNKIPGFNKTQQTKTITNKSDGTSSYQHTTNY